MDTAFAFEVPDRIGAAAPVETTAAVVRYLRVVVTAKCPLACAYCHHEGDPPAGSADGRGWSEVLAKSGTVPQARMAEDELFGVCAAGVANGVRKIKFLGGEPLLSSDLPRVVARLRALDASLDLSVITSGALPPARLDALFEAGLSRANLSIHGWGEAAFGQRKGNAFQYANRQANLARLLSRGRPLKLNYVYAGPQNLDDLGGLLAWAAGRALVVNVLDDLGRDDLGPDAVIAAVTALRGPPASVATDPDPRSLDTLHLRWPDGLRVEVKHQRLGAVAPWRACVSCPVRARCGEGIHAARVTHDGRLRPCMDRPDLGVDLRAALRSGGVPGAAAAWGAWVSDALRTGAPAGVSWTGR